MWKNTYLSIKNPKASRALKWALDPDHILLASLAQLHFTTWATFSLRCLGPPPWPNPGSAPENSNYGSRFTFPNRNVIKCQLVPPHHEYLQSGTFKTASNRVIRCRATKINTVMILHAHPWFNNVEHGHNCDTYHMKFSYTIEKPSTIC